MVNKVPGPLNREKVAGLMRVRANIIEIKAFEKYKLYVFGKNSGRAYYEDLKWYLVYALGAQNLVKASWFQSVKDKLDLNNSKDMDNWVKIINEFLKAAKNEETSKTAAKKEDSKYWKIAEGLDSFLRIRDVIISILNACSSQVSIRSQKFADEDKVVSLPLYAAERPKITGTTFTFKPSTCEAEEDIERIKELVEILSSHKPAGYAITVVKDKKDNEYTAKRAYNALENLKTIIEGFGDALAPRRVKRGIEKNLDLKRGIIIAKLYKILDAYISDNKDENRNIFSKEGYENLEKAIKNEKDDNRKAFLNLLKSLRDILFYLCATFQSKGISDIYFGKYISKVGGWLGKTEFISTFIRETINFKDLELRKNRLWDNAKEYLEKNKGLKDAKKAFDELEDILAKLSGILS